MEIVQDSTSTNYGSIAIGGYTNDQTVIGFSTSNYQPIIGYYKYPLMNLAWAFYLNIDHTAIN